MSEAPGRSLLPGRPHEPLLPHAGGRTVVSESGLERAETLAALESEGVHAFLVGEALMRAEDPGAALARLRGGP